jgi:hypothetical protein
MFAYNRTKGASAPFSPDKQMFRREEKGAFSLFFSSEHLTSGVWALELDSNDPYQVIHR